MTTTLDYELGRAAAMLGSEFKAARGKDGDWITLNGAHVQIGGDVHSKIFGGDGEPKAAHEMTRAEFGVPDEPVKPEEPFKVTHLVKKASESPESLTDRDKEVLAINKQRRSALSKHKRLSAERSEKANQHLAAIEKAISDGKTVPARVLKDYPYIVHRLEREADRVASGRKSDDDETEYSDTPTLDYELGRAAALMGDEFKKYDARQPRDDHGKWSNGAGGISAGHAAHVMRSEGISAKHAAGVLSKIADGTHKSREDVLKHIDAVHSASSMGGEVHNGIAFHPIHRQAQSATQTASLNDLKVGDKIVNPLNGSAMEYAGKVTGSNGKEKHLGKIIFPNGETNHDALPRDIQSRDGKVKVIEAAKPASSSKPYANWDGMEKHQEKFGKTQDAYRANPTKENEAAHHEAHRQLNKFIEGAVMADRGNIPFPKSSGSALGDAMEKQAAKPASTAAVHEMTGKEFRALSESEQNKASGLHFAASNSHLYAVDKAASEGKRVPDHVLDEHKQYLNEKILSAVKRGGGGEYHEDVIKWAVNRVSPLDALEYYPRGVHPDLDKKAQQGRKLMGWPDRKSEEPDEETMNDTLVHFGGEIKSVEETETGWKFGGFLVVFDKPDVSSQRDTFTKSTDFDIEDGDRRSVYYNHGLDGTIKREKLGDCRVQIKDAGVWITGEIKKRTDYLAKHAEHIAENIKHFGLSSGAPAHMVERERTATGHEIKKWVLSEASITPTPAEPMTGMLSIKSLQEIEGDADLFDDEFKAHQDGDWITINGAHVQVGSAQHARITGGEKGTDSGHAAIDAAAERHGLSKDATDALHKAHSEGKIVTRNHLDRTIVAAKDAADNGLNRGNVSARHIEAALEVHGADGRHDTPDRARDNHQNPVDEPGGSEPARDSARGSSGAASSTDVVSAAKEKNLSGSDTAKLKKAHSDGKIKTRSDLKQAIGDIIAKSGKFHDYFNQGKDFLNTITGKSEDLFDDELKATGTAEALPYPQQQMAVDYPTRKPVLVDGEDEENRCGACGRGVDDEATKCRHCGAKVTPLSQKSIDDFDDEMKKYNSRQPRDDDGRWGNGSGGISIGHALHVAKHEGIADEHHAGIESGIRSGKLDTREKVLAHIDAIHAGGSTPAAGNASEPRVTLSPKLTAFIEAADAKLNAKAGYRANDLTENIHNLLNKGEVEVGWRTTAGAGALDRTAVIHREWLRVVKKLKGEGVQLEVENQKHGNAWATRNGGFWDSEIYRIVGTNGKKSEDDDDEPDEPEYKQLTELNEGLLDGLSLDIHFTKVLAANEELSERIQSLADMRCVKSNRRWSADKYSQLNEMADGLATVAASVKTIAQAHAPRRGTSQDALKMLAEIEITRARLNRVAV